MKTPFKLKDFLGVDPADIEKLNSVGIKTAAQMLAAGATRAGRAALAGETGIRAEALRELVGLSDLARLPGVKGIRARLYYAAGVTSVAQLAACEPEPLRLLAEDFVRRTGFSGIPPLPKEVSSTIANARCLPLVVEDEQEHAFKDCPPAQDDPFLKVGEIRDGSG